MNFLEGVSVTSLSSARIGQETNIEFLAEIDKWVLTALEDQQPPFEDFFVDLPGVFPSEVLASLRRLEASSQIPKNFLKMIERDARRLPRRGKIRIADHAIRKHIDHPLDFEWPFARKAHEEVLSTLNSFGGMRSMNVLCLGCPSVFRYAHLSHSIHRFILLDKNASLSGQMNEAQSISNCDLSKEPVPGIVAQAAVIDPPWYMPYYKLFIWAAMKCLVLGGRLLISFPPEGTRPSARNDLRDLLMWCRHIGAELQGRAANCLPYRAPLFEMNALKVQGIRNIPVNWRRGDLIVLAKMRHVEMSRPVCTGEFPDWDEYRIGLVRIKVCRSTTDGRGSPLRCVARTAILPSVSTRYPGREKANVVTSGNRFFHTNSPTLFAAICHDASRFGILQNMRHHQRSSAFPSHSLLRRQLRNLLIQEENEIINYSKATYGI